MKPGIRRIAASVNCQRLSSTAKTYLDEMLVAVMMDLVANTTKLRQHSNLQTVQPKHVEAALELTFSYKGEMVKHAKNEANQSLQRYIEAKKMHI